MQNTATLHLSPYGIPNNAKLFTQPWRWWSAATHMPTMCSKWGPILPCEHYMALIPYPVMLFAPLLKTENVLPSR